MNRKRVLILTLALLIFGLMVGAAVSIEDQEFDGAPMPQLGCGYFDNDCPLGWGNFGADQKSNRSKGGGCLWGCGTYTPAKPYRAPRHAPPPCVFPFCGVEVGRELAPYDAGGGNARREARRQPSGGGGGWANGWCDWATKC